MFLVGDMFSPSHIVFCTMLLWGNYNGELDDDDDDDDDNDDDEDDRNLPQGTGRCLSPPQAWVAGSSEVAGMFDEASSSPCLSLFFYPNTPSASPVSAVAQSLVGAVGICLHHKAGGHEGCIC